jgi:hypothetical protein
LDLKRAIKLGIINFEKKKKINENSNKLIDNKGACIRRKYLVETFLLLYNLGSPKWGF